ncbi:MAG: Mu transposase domain-containing protein, partial [Bacteroidota bacterium]
LKEQVCLLNARTMQQEGCSRQILLERDERVALQPLPKQRYEIRNHLQLTVQANSHVYISRQKKYYSAPYQYIGNKVHVIITSSLVRIYCKGEGIATHPANRSLKYNTQDQHLPSHHRLMRKGMNEQVLKERAAVYGQEVLKVIIQVLKSSHHPEQAYNSCLEISRILTPLFRVKLTP